MGQSSKTARWQLTKPPNYELFFLFNLPAEIYQMSKYQIPEQLNLLISQ